MFFSKTRIFAALIAATAMPAPSMAQDPVAISEDGAHSQTSAAITFTKTITENATLALTDADATDAEKLANFQNVLTEGLALETIGKFMLGSHRKTMTEAQLSRYGATFPDYITKLYAEQFEDIIGKPLNVIDAKPIGSRDTIVRTLLEQKNGANAVTVDWRIRKLRSGEQKAIDIIVSGVSIMLVKREEFSAFIATNGVDALLDRLELEAA